MAKEISKDAQSLISTAPQGFQEYALQNAPGDVVTSGEAQRLLNQFKASDAYSAQNVSQALGTPAPAPNLSDPMGLYDYYLQSPEIKAAQTEYQAAFGELQKAKETGRAQQTAIQNLPQALNVIRGEQAQATQLSSDRIAALAEAADVSFSKLSALRQTGTERFGIAQSQRKDITDLITKYPGAKITYKDTVESATQKAYDFGVKQAEETKKTEYKDSLKTLALQYGLKTSGNIKDLEKRIKKVSKESLEIARKTADITYETAVENLRKLREKTGTSTIDIASLPGYANTTVMTPSGGVSTSNPAAYQNANPFWEYLNNNNEKE